MRRSRTWLVPHPLTHPEGQGRRHRRYQIPEVVEDLGLLRLAVAQPPADLDRLRRVDDRVPGVTLQVPHDALGVAGG
jgi:hypothetical protein